MTFVYFYNRECYDSLLSCYICFRLGVPGVVAGSVGGVFGLTLLIHAISYCKKQWNANRDNDERQPILGNVEVIDNPVEELNPANQLPSPIGSSQAKPDVNVIRSVRS